MLQPMQQPAPSQPSPSLSGFAGLLASFTSPPPPSDPADDAALWSSSDPVEDVATITYERVLHTHARYRPANRDLDRDLDRDLNRDLDRESDRDTGRGEKSPAPSAGPQSIARANAPGEIGAAGAIGAARATDAAAALDAADAAPGLQASVALDRDLRSASVTIRLSRMECARLHQRAAEAGLTVSAYLRSCAVEAEALRAQVKRALAELKAGTEQTRDQGNKKSARRSFLGWIRCLAQRER